MRWTAIVALCTAVLIPGVGLARAQQELEAGGGEYVAVRYDTGVHAQAIRAFGQRPPTLEEDGWRQVRVPPGKSRDEFVAELKADPGVVDVEAQEDGAVQAAFVPNDPYYAPTPPNQVSYLEQINAAEAWDLETGSDEVVVAVLDSGLDLTHEEFAGHLWENPYDANTNGIDDDGNGCVDDRYGCRFIDLTTSNQQYCGYTRTSTNGGPGDLAYGDVMDDHGDVGTQHHSHGTIVSGILAASGNNGRGIAGMAWNVKIMTVKVLDCGKTSPSLNPGGRAYNLAEGIDYAVRMGANIISLSLALQDDSPVVRTAVQHAQEAGVIVVAAAGNFAAGTGSVGVEYPAAYTEFPNVVAVGATNNEVSATSWAPYSRYGPAVDFAAPANNVLSTVRSDLGFPIPYGATGSITNGGAGTSFATPFVAGTFALMMSRNPRLAANDYIQIARDTATPATPAPHGQNWAGAGIINAGAAVARVPMVITGEALHDWRYVGANTEVRAVVDGLECGATTTQNIGLISRYTIKVKAETEQPGCGAPGKTVRLTIGGSPAQPTFTWGGRDESLALLDRDASTVTPPPGSVVVQALNGGWSNIAVLDNSGALPNVLASLSGWSAVYRWNPLLEGFGIPGDYDRYAKGVPDFVNTIDSLATYEAIWIDGPAGNVAMLNPNPTEERSVGLEQGWNNFVYTGTSKQVSDALAEISGKYTAVLQYDNAAMQWRVYSPGQPRYVNDFGGLFKLQVYWIYVTQPAVLTMK